jgi:FAD/FMN-containing dehydrogenase
MVENDIFCSLRGRLTGSLVTRSSGYWDVARAAWVLDAEQRPSAVVHAETAQDVAETLAFAALHDLRVAPQVTRHDAAPLGDLSGTIRLTTSRMRRIEIDADRLTARVEAGVL